MVVGVSPDSLMMAVEAVRKNVLDMVDQLDEVQLMQVVTSLTLTIKDSKKTRKEALRNAIRRHLSSEDLEDSADEGLAVFEKLNEELSGMLDVQNVDDKTQIEQLKKTVDALLKRDPSGGGASSTGDSSGGVQNDGEQEDKGTVRIDLNRVKIREFKITNGTVGAGENCLPYSTVCFQMKEGEEAGFTSRELRSGVIKAMKPGFTRTYFEGKADQFSHDEFMEMLQEVYSRKLSDELLDEMGDCAQGPNQKEGEYVVAMFARRDHIMKVTEKEEEPLTWKQVQRKMLHAISVGLRKATIRVMLSPILQDLDVKDSVLLKKVNDTVTWDKENEKRMGDDASVQSLDVKSKHHGGKNNSTSQKKTEGELHALVNRISAQMEEQEKSMQQLRKQVSTFVNAQGSRGGGNNSQGGGNNSQGGGNGGGQINGGGNNNRNRINNHSGNNQQQQQPQPQPLAQQQHQQSRNSGGYRLPFFLKCEDCQRNGNFCTHCSNCGEDDHKRRDCPKN